MSSTPSPRGAAPAYDEAERGTHDTVTVFPDEKKALTFPADEKKDLFPNEKKDVFAAPQVKKDPYMAPKGGKKKKVSKLILFKLWYNTYR